MTLDEFLTELKRLSKPGDWEMNSLGMIRAKHLRNHTSVCPITEVVARKTGRVYHTCLAEAAGETINLHPRDVTEVMLAADEAHGHDSTVRDRLLNACYLDATTTPNKQ